MLEVTQLSGFSTSTQADDPHWDKVSALYHFDGSNGGTVFIDSSKNNVTPTVIFNAQTSTAQSKFGGSSFYNAGAGNRLEVYYNTASVVDFGTNDFTVECWVYRITTGTRQFIFDTRGSGSVPLGMRIEGTNVLEVIRGGTQLFLGTTVLSGSTWNHFAISRSGTTMRIFIDGVQEGSITNSDSFTQTAGGRYVIAASGFALGNNPLNGYIDEFRITRGVARYTSGFTPQTKAFPSLI